MGIKILISTALVIIVSIFCSGCQSNKEYTVLSYRETLSKGSSVEAVAEKYYKANQDGRSWEEFRYDVGQANSNLFANGRAPQIGDKVIITIRKEVSK